MITRRRRLPGDGPGVEGSPGHMSRHARPTCCRLLPQVPYAPGTALSFPLLRCLCYFFPTSMKSSLLFSVHDFVFFSWFSLHSVFYLHIVSLLLRCVFNAGFLFAIHFRFPWYLLIKDPLESQYCYLCFALFAVFG